MNVVIDFSRNKFFKHNFNLLKSTLSLCEENRKLNQK